jgi:hypothetical protein
VWMCARVNTHTCGCVAVSSLALNHNQDSWGKMKRNLSCATTLQGLATLPCTTPLYARVLFLLFTGSMRMYLNHFALECKRLLG